MWWRRFCSIMKVQKMDRCINFLGDASRRLVGFAFPFLLGGIEAPQVNDFLGFGCVFLCGKSKISMHGTSFLKVREIVTVLIHCSAAWMLWRTSSHTQLSSKNLLNSQKDSPIWSGSFPGFTQITARLKILSRCLRYVSSRAK